MGTINWSPGAETGHQNQWLRRAGRNKGALLGAPQ